MQRQLGFFLVSRHSRNARKRLETDKMLILWHFWGGTSGTNFCGDSPMDLFSPPKKLHVRVHARLQKLFFCKWYFLPIFTQPDQIKLFLLLSSNKFLLNGYKHSGTLFLGSSYHYLFKNIAHDRSICKFDPKWICVFVKLYLRSCMSDTREHCFWGPRTITFSKI